MRVLLLFNEIPETLKFYVINDPTPEELVVLKNANGGLLNAMDNTPEQEAAAGILNVALAKPEYVSADSLEDEYKVWASHWADTEITEELLPTAGPFDIVISSGFIL